MSEGLGNIPLDFSNWTLYKTVEPFRILGVPVEGLKQLCYQKELDGAVISAGVFELNGTPTHVAWGLKSEPHCSFHALALPQGGWGTTVKGCPEYKLLSAGGATTGFSVDGSLFPIKTA